MKNKGIIAAVFLFFVLAQTAAFAGVAASPTTTHYSQAQIKRLMREASTPDQYRVIARYFEQRQSEFSGKAADQMAEWARRSQDVTGPAAKYPRPVDEARNLYEYYAHEADDAAFQADKYNRFALGAEAVIKH
jgi:hypothetical protein